MNLPELGVGLSYFSALDPILTESGLVDYIEIEPATLWRETRSRLERYRIDEEELARLRSLPMRKLLHGVGFPVGGSRPPDPRHLPLFARMVDELGPPWVSEHLSFNRAAGPNGEFCTGFLLPPRQTPEGARAAAASIRSVADGLPVPMAVETGVNYLRLREDEMPDGAFAAAVAEAADCGILLDLHNLWANERNGRQPVEAFLSQIPLERVWEVHLAGGSEFEGYWLDSHSGGVPEPLLDLSRRAVPRLPNLKAITFEMFASSLPDSGLGLVRDQMARLRELWAVRGSSAAPASGRRDAGATPRAEARPPPLREWEDVLGALVVGRDATGPLADSLRADPGVRVIRDLIREFRASMVAGALKLTTRLLLLTVGEKGFDDLLGGYWAESAPELFNASEAAGFAEYIAGHLPRVPYLPDVLAFERATLGALVDGDGGVVRFSHDPLVVLRALSEGRMPASPRSGNFEVEVTSDGGAPGSLSQNGNGGFGWAH